jgi:anaerobic magnesium-protoporphyrin IX monomethyl ester cyclase
LTCVKDDNELELDQAEIDAFTVAPPTLPKTAAKASFKVMIE